jgi:hypothetical protein
VVIWAFGAIVIRVSAVRQIVQRHFGGNPWHCLHQEVACGPVQKGMLDHFAPLVCCWQILLQKSKIEQP